MEILADAEIQRSNVKSLREANETLRLHAEKNKKEADDYAEHLKAEVEASKASILEAAAELKARDEQVERYQLKHASLSEDASNLQKELEAAIAQSSRDGRALEETVYKHQVLEEQLKKEKETVHLELSSTQEELAAVRENAMNLTGDTTELAAKLMQREQSVQDLDSKLQVLTAELDDVGSSAEKSKHQAQQYATHLQGEVESRKVRICRTATLLFCCILHIVLRLCTICIIVLS